MAQPNKPKYQLKDLIGIDRDHRTAQAILILANEVAEQNARLELLLSKYR